MVEEIMREELREELRYGLPFAGSKDGGLCRVWGDLA